MLAECYRNSSTAIHCMRSLRWGLFSSQDSAATSPLPFSNLHLDDDVCTNTIRSSFPNCNCCHKLLCHRRHHDAPLPPPAQHCWIGLLFIACLSESARMSEWPVMQVASYYCLGWGVFRAWPGSFGGLRRGFARWLGGCDGAGWPRISREASATPHEACPSADSNHRLG